MLLIRIAAMFVVNNSDADWSFGQGRAQFITGNSEAARDHGQHCQSAWEVNPASPPTRERFMESIGDIPLDEYLRVRWHTETLVATSNPEDMAAQSMPDASSAKWHPATANQE